MSGPRFELLLLGAGAALAALLSTPEAAADPVDEPEDVPAPIPAAKDRLGGHLLLRAGPLIALPFGALDGGSDGPRSGSAPLETRYFSDAAGLGIGVSADLGIGVSRSVVLGGWFEYATFGEPNDRCHCDARSMAFGPFARYHLVQGTRFDPWLGLGVGYRRVETTGPSESYTGFDARLELGGDWYALSQVAFGPYAGLALGSFTDRPAGRDGSVYGSFSAGLRIALDVQGR